jgi:putative hemolysin
MTLQSVGSADLRPAEQPGPGVALAPAEALRLPPAGPLLVASTSPLGADARAALLAALRARRPDLRGVCANGATLLCGGVADLAERALARGAAVVRAHVARGRVLLGSPTTPATLAALRTATARDAYLGWLAKALVARASARGEPADSGRTAGPARALPTPGRSHAGPARDRREPLAAPGDPAALRREIDALPQADRICESERWIVARARAAAIPALLTEIGRAREESFRAAGEGTGRPLDLDRFDPAYWHLFAWSRARGELAGAYRLRETEDALRAAGPGGLYTSTLFDYRAEFFARLGPALELGRAFVRPEYQRSLALAQIWRALARWVHSRGPCALFGAVSLSSEYGEFSRTLVAAALLRNRPHLRLAGLATPRNPVAAIEAARRDPALDCLDDPALLSAVVAEAEPSHAPLPVLIREYLKLGGRFVAWNLDPDFADALDGLVVVELGEGHGAVVDRWAARR